MIGDLIDELKHLANEMEREALIHNQAARVELLRMIAAALGEKVS